MVFYPLESQEYRIAATSLCPAEERIYTYLRTLNPFVSPKFHIAVEDLAADLEYHCDTILRCLRKLREYGLVAYHMYRRTLYSFEFTSPAKGQAESQHQEQLLEPELSHSVVDDDRFKRSKDRFKRSFDRLNKNEDPAVSGVSDNQPVTNNRGLNLNLNNGETPKNEQSVIGQILASIEAIGVRANYTIQKEVYRLHREFGPDAAAQRVELAIEAVQERVRKGGVRNLGGLMKRALERTFTPNEDGYRESKKERSSQVPPAPVAAAPPAPGAAAAPFAPGATAAPPAPGATAAPPALGATAAPPRLSPKHLSNLEYWIDVQLLQGDRASVLTRLQAAIDRGYEEDLIELLQVRRDWKIKLKPGVGLIEV